MSALRKSYPNHPSSLEAKRVDTLIIHIGKFESALSEDEILTTLSEPREQKSYGPSASGY
jgi:hypothetical protein